MSSSSAATIDHHHDPTTSTGIPNKKLLMWAFLASDCMFFGALISTHLIYRLHPPAGALSPKEVFAPALTSFSTFILLMSSLMMALAVNAIQKGNVKSTRWSLLTTIFFGMIFLGCQVYEFTEFVEVKGMKLSNSLLGTTFFTLTGTHGCHVAIGVLWLSLMYVRSFKPAASVAKPSWCGMNLVHAGTLLVALLAALKVTLAFVFEFVEKGANGESIGFVFAHDWIYMAIAIIALIALIRFERPAGPVDFGERNAIDVES